MRWFSDVSSRFAKVVRHRRTGRNKPLARRSGQLLGRRSPHLEQLEERTLLSIGELPILPVGYTPTDPLFVDQWHLDNTGQTGAIADADIDAPEAWDIEPSSPDIVVAVISDGVDLSHPDLSIFVHPDEIPGNSIDDDGNGYVDDVSGWDFVGGDNDASPGDPADNYGTALAGVVAAVADNAAGGSGVAPNVQIMPIRAFEGGSEQLTPPTTVSFRQGVDGYGGTQDTSLDADRGNRNLNGEAWVRWDANN